MDDITTLLTFIAFGIPVYIAGWCAGMRARKEAKS